MTGPRKSQRYKFFSCDNCGERTPIEDREIMEDDSWLCPDCYEDEDWENASNDR